MVDIEANGYLFLNRPLAVRLSRALDIRIQKLPYLVPIRGYQNRIQSRADRYIRLHLTMDGRKVYNCLLVIFDLEDQDIIIGIK